MVRKVSLRVAVIRIDEKERLLHNERMPSIVIAPIAVRFRKPTEKKGDQRMFTTLSIF